MKLRDLLDIPECGIYALIHEKSKRIFLYYSNNMSSHLMRLVQNLKYGRVREPHLKRYRKDYQFEIIEKLPIPASNQERLLQRFSLREIEKKYKDLGYQVVVPCNTPKFKFFVILDSNFIKLFIINKNNDRILLGVFSTKKECDSYVEFLGTPKYVICNNRLTLDYMNSTIEK